MTIVNGIDVESLNATVEAVEQNPELGRCVFHSRTV